MDLEPGTDASMDGAVCLDERGAGSEGQELLDFLAADVDPIPADPAFRERLREELWSLVQRGDSDHPKGH